MAQITQKTLQESVVVVAHPDDEILWFSSILADIKEFVVCFLDVPSKPQWTRGRARSLAEYPLPKLARLDLTEAEIFWDTDWVCPVETKFGLAITTPGNSENQYKRNFTKLQRELRNKLTGAKTVFTHNPWGEYGNAEHIQVYRAIKALQQDLNFDIWVTSYFSNISAALMLKSATIINGNYVTLPTNLELAKLVTDLYKKNNCWTWYDDYRWPADESFFLVTDSATNKLRHGLVRPLQFIHIDESRPSKAKLGMYERLCKSMKRRISKLSNI